LLSIFANLVLRLPIVPGIYPITIERFIFFLEVISHDNS
jgi:hypothetical protein